MTIPRRTLGSSSALDVSALGLGCMGMSRVLRQPPTRPSRIATIHRALDLGVTFLDTADMYGPFTNEELVGKAIAGRRDEVAARDQVRQRAATRTAPGRRSTAARSTSARACDASLQRLGVDHIDLYYQHRVDQTVPIEETVGAMAELVEAGKVRHLGLSEAVRRTRSAAPTPCTRSPRCRPSTRCGPATSRTRSCPTLRELGIGLVPYSPLGRGFLTGAITSEAVARGGRLPRRSAYFPRFHGEDLRRQPRARRRTVRAIADEKGCTPGQLALAWVLAQGDDDVVPDPRHQAGHVPRGERRRARRRAHRRRPGRARGRGARRRGGG